MVVRWKIYLAHIRGSQAPRFRPQLDVETLHTL